MSWGSSDSLTWQGGSDVKRPPSPPLSLQCLAFHQHVVGEPSPWCLGTGKHHRSSPGSSALPRPSCQGSSFLFPHRHFFPKCGQHLCSSCPVWPSGIQPFVISGVPGTSSLAGSSDLYCPGLPVLSSLALHLMVWTSVSPEHEPFQASPAHFPPLFTQRPCQRSYPSNSVDSTLQALASISLCRVCVCACVGDLRL